MISAIWSVVKSTAYRTHSDTENFQLYVTGGCRSAFPTTSGRVRIDVLVLDSRLLHNLL